MINRRTFTSLFGSGLIASYLTRCSSASASQSTTMPINTSKATILTTWNNQNANELAHQALLKTNTAAGLLDALEKGINSVESDPNDSSVGYGGRPDRDGHVTLDACIMDHQGQAGSVTFMEGYKKAISVARKVMEETPHVILSGVGAEQFAHAQGFTREGLLTKISRQEYAEWLKKGLYQPKINIESHDTIGMLVRNGNADLAGGCSTSGLAYKMRGRVGDSPIIGAGLYVDNKIGSAVATGLGELVLRQLSSFLAVEMVRQGHSPQNACKIAIERIAKSTDVSDKQVGLLAMNKGGETGAYSIHPGFSYVLTDDESSVRKEAPSYL